MSGGIALAECDIRDLDTIMTVMEASFDPAYGEAWTAPQCAGLMPMPGVWLRLAYKDSQAVGFSMSRIVLKEAELLLLAVRPECRNCGIGQLLLDRFLSEARGRGADQFHLEVRDGNCALTLYERAGFEEVGRRNNYYTGRNGELHDALTLAMKLCA